MLGGSIDIRSQVGQGTEVMISIPLMRAAETSSKTSTPGVLSSMEGSYDNPIPTLQTEYRNKTVALYGVDLTTESGRVLYEYISKWFGFEVFLSLSAKPVDLIIVDEKLFPALLEAKLIEASVIVLCSNSSRYNRKVSCLDDASPVEFVSKPYGPYKLAKALRLCLERAQNTISHAGSISSKNPPNEDSLELGLKALSLTLEKGLKSISVQTDRVIPTSKAVNAEIAISPRSVALETKRSVGHDTEFPFPVHQAERLDTRATVQDHTVLNRRDPRRSNRDSEPSKDSNLNPVNRIPEPLTQPPEKRPPRLLLVDDNSINLRLLETYFRKQKLHLVDSAENGEIAVKAVKRHSEGYDIIFMGDLATFL